ncbi:hypothetical protein DRP05_11710 [Archaeoglobales archaeon]|nr:MAG: hypothetical protein DRP05_11710 [Archaeoglobales archaeon]
MGLRGLAGKLGSKVRVKASRVRSRVNRQTVRSKAVSFSRKTRSLQQAYKEDYKRSAKRKLRRMGILPKSRGQRGQRRGRR